MIKRAVMIAVLAVVVAALALPLASMRTRAAGSSNRTAPVANPAAKAAAPASAQPQQAAAQDKGREMTFAGGVNAGPTGKISPELLQGMGLGHQGGGKKAAKKARRQDPQVGEPLNMCAGSALSAAIATTVGGRDNQFSEVATLGDWDGREDCAADHSGKVDDFSSIETDIDQSQTRVAISEHTIANGFGEDIFYYGDSVGNVFVGSTTNLNQASPTPTVFQINLAQALVDGGVILPTDDQIAITGLAVNPVADLTAFANQTSQDYSAFAGVTGEILYVSFWDSESGLNLAGGISTPQQLVRSGVLAIPIADPVSPGPGGGVISPAAFPITVGVPWRIFFSVFANVGGIAVDDDGSLYFHQVDLIQFTGGNIVKITSTDTPGLCVPGTDTLANPPGFAGPNTGANQDRALVVANLPTLTSLTPSNGLYIASSSGPANQVNRYTNYSGTSTLFGNIVSLAAGPCNVVYAAVARSANPSDDAFTQLTEGPFAANATAFPNGTPSMVISFADCAGAFAACTVPQNPVTGAFVSPSLTGFSALSVADGFADPAAPGISLTPGVNNFRIFVMGNGPNIANPSTGTSSVPGTPASLLQINDGMGFQIDYTLHSGITVNEEGTVYVISGGTPAGIGKNPSPMLGEILCFEDICPADRRADPVDLRGATTLPNPPNVGNVGDGLSTRTDHIFYQSPLDQVTITPAGLAGLTRGFLRYTNRLAPVPIGRDSAGNAVTLGTTDRTLGDDDTTHTAGGPGATGAPVVFETLDPCHQVAGGDDQFFPFTGDDDNGAGSPVVTGPLSGGFEFLFANPVNDIFPPGGSSIVCGTGNGVWNGLFWNSNGNVTFGAGDTSPSADVVAFRSGLPKIAPAWTDLNPGSRTGNPGIGGGSDSAFPNTFPVMALGFANINDFRIRWINVPEFGNECCNSSNTFSINLFDDGTGIDENANQPLNPANPIGNNAVPFDLLEGATANRFVKEVNTGVVVGCPPRRDGTGMFVFEYCRMDLLGTSGNPVIAGFSIGAQNGLNPPGICPINLSTAALAAETTFGIIQGETAAVSCNCCLGEGTEPTLFELFNTGSGPSTGAGGEVTFATPAFDLRFEGNDPALCTATRQRDNNRGRICFFGVTCQLPPNPTCLLVLPSVPGAALTAPIVVAPGQPAVGTAAAATPNGSGTRVASPTAGIINALCSLNLNIIGCGFFPNEGQTTICQGFTDQTGAPIGRNGKTVTTAAAFNCDTNGDGVPDLVIPLTNVTPFNCNFVRGSLSPLASAAGTPFPFACCGGFGTVTTTTTFTAGNNNIFNLLSAGGFTRTSTCAIDVGQRAPVVVSVTPSTGDCSIRQDLLISGFCFVLPSGATNVTSVFAQELGNPNNTIQASSFSILGPNLIDAFFQFTTANAGKTFLIFVSGPNGTSQNLTTLPAGTTCPAGFVGNQQGTQVSFKCDTLPPNPGSGGNPQIDQAIVSGCSLDRLDSGVFQLTVTGKNIKDNATITVGGIKPKKVKFKAAAADTTRQLVLKGKFCGGLPGAIVITNPPQTGVDVRPSAPFTCNQSCPAQQ